MELALTTPERVGKLIVADIAPVTYTEQHLQILEALQQVVDRRCETRAEAEAVLCEVIEDPGVVGYLLMNLERADGACRWRFNLTGWATLTDDCDRRPLRRRRFRVPLYFYRAANSAYIQQRTSMRSGGVFPTVSWLPCRTPGIGFMSTSRTSLTAQCGRFCWRKGHGDLRFPVLSRV